MTPLQEVIQVLRTTNAKQTRNAFVHFERLSEDSGAPVSYCALGVLICNKEHIKDSNHFRLLNTTEVWKKYNIDIMGLTLKTEDYDEPLRMGDDLVLSLYGLITMANDIYFLTFKEIADLLETTFEDGII